VFLCSTRYPDAVETIGDFVDMVYGCLLASGKGLQVLFWSPCSTVAWFQLFSPEVAGACYAEWSRRAAYAYEVVARFYSANAVGFRESLQSDWLRVFFRCTCSAPTLRLACEVFAGGVFIAESFAW
jgi:hypothetical protein